MKLTAQDRRIALSPPHGVRLSSIDSYITREEDGIAGRQRKAIAGYVREANRFVSRNEIAMALGLVPGTVSGQVKPLLEAGILRESLSRMECPVTHNHVYMLIHMSCIGAGIQKEMFGGAQ